MRFQVGEVAIFAIARTPDEQRFVGQYVTICFKNQAGRDYETNISEVEDGVTFILRADDWQLKRVDTPEFAIHLEVEEGKYEILTQDKGQPRVKDMGEKKK